MFSDKYPAHGQADSPNEYRVDVGLVSMFQIIAEQHWRTHCKAEGIGCVGGKKAEQAASGFEHMQAAEEHVGTVAWA